MECDPTIPPYLTSDPNTFAYVSARSRWAVIIDGIIQDITRTLNTASDEKTIEEGRLINQALQELKGDIQGDKTLNRIPNDGQPDVDEYNNELEKRTPITWHHAPWLFAECYLYRRIASLFYCSTKWLSYDVFARQKMETFQSSRPAVLELAARYKELMVELSANVNSTSDQEVRKTEELLFIEMCEICLWGNATDLSLLTNLSYDDIQKLQGSAARKAAENNIIVNHLPQVFADLKKTESERPKTAQRRVDLVLDNAGFELFVDLVLAGYMIKSGLATKVVLHPKSIPWFVSDVIPVDFAALLNALADPNVFFSSNHSSETNDDLSVSEEANLKFLYNEWSTLHASGLLVLQPHVFWTGPGGFWRLPTTAPSLYSDLRTSDLVIFKGDLNGRKLAGDCMWPTTTPFAESLGPLAKQGKGLKVLELRTCKADVVVGLPEGTDERLKATEGGCGDKGARKWAWSGKWAVCLFNDAR